MAEFLVKAKNQWMESVPEIDRVLWPEKKQAKFERRTVKGDIICVRPDGWKWGKREDPARMAVYYPDDEIEYVIVKVMGMPVEEAREYEASHRVPDTQSLAEGEVGVLKKRKYNFSVVDVEAAKKTLQPIVLTKIELEQKTTDKSVGVVLHG